MAPAASITDVCPYRPAHPALAVRRVHGRPAANRRARARQVGTNAKQTRGGNARRRPSYTYRQVKARRAMGQVKARHAMGQVKARRAMGQVKARRAMGQVKARRAMGGFSSHSREARTRTRTRTYTHMRARAHTHTRKRK